MVSGYRECMVVVDGDSGMKEKLTYRACETQIL